MFSKIVFKQALTLKEFLRACLIVVFNNCFLFLETKNIENMFEKKGVFCFLCFPNSQLENNNKMFLLVFSYSVNNYSSCCLLLGFCVSLPVFSPPTRGL